MEVFFIEFCECGSYLTPKNGKLICKKCGFEKDSDNDTLSSYKIKD